MPAYYLEIIVVALGLVLLLLDAFAPAIRKTALAAIGCLGLLVVFGLLFVAQGPSPEAAGTGFWRFYAADSLALFYKGVVLLTTVLVLVMAAEYRGVIGSYLGEVKGEKGNAGLGEFYCIPLFVCAGLMWMASANDLTSMFVALELVTISFYVLVAYMRRNVGSVESGVKYLILGALSTGFFVYGMAWIFGITGQTNLAAIREVLATGEVHQGALLWGAAFLLAGLGFKLAAVPFQFWAPDVYQGAPTPVTAFLSVGSKAGAVVVLSRVLDTLVVRGSGVQQDILQLVLIIAAATILFGSLAAIPQTNIKRLLAYSSVGNGGFLLLALACVFPGNLGMPAATVAAFYLATYLFMTMLCFMVVSAVRVQTGAEDLTGFRGLSKRSPLLAFALMTGMVSLAGLPLTVGFLGKFFVFITVVEHGYYWALVVAIIGAAAGFYYYFNVVRAMYWDEPQDDARPVRAGGLTRVAVLALTIAVIAFGVYPRPLLNALPRATVQIEETTPGDPAVEETGAEATDEAAADEQEPVEESDQSDGSD